MMRRYAVLDVFSETPLAGNALAVVLQAEGLDDQEMQRIAAEFNLSETVFVLPAENPAHSARARIFTPRNELPFAGHPTVGTAVLLGLERTSNGTGATDVMVVLEEGIGPVRCGVELSGSASGRAVFDVPKLAEETGTAPDKENLAAALSLEPHEIGFENHLPSVFDAGLPFLFVPVYNRDAIGRARPDLSSWPESGAPMATMFLYCRDTEGVGRQFHARMFAPTAGIPEDPATGSAVAALAGVVRKFDPLSPGTHYLTIEQGFEMGRPSLISLEIDIEGTALHAVRIGGNAVVVAEGTLKL